MNEALLDPVADFVAVLVPALRELDVAATDERAQRDAMVEAAALCAAFIDVDERHTDDEIWGYLRAFASLFDGPLALATPDQVRRTDLLVGKRAWLAQPSLLFDTLVHADRQHATRHARRYYDAAMALAHAVVALDHHVGYDELVGLERFRTMLLSALAVADQPPVPGASRTPGAPDSPAGVTAIQAAKAAATAAAAAEPQTPPRSVDELLAELDALVGLAPVKAEVKLVTALIRVQKLREERDLPVATSSRHLVFTGNPGTGKTTVARLVAQLYRSLGVVEKGHLVETDRAGLVAGYVGQTALKTQAVCEQAMGGILLVDEAYALARGGDDDFGREATDTLVKIIEDRRDDFAVIVAGYPEEMAEFIDSNPGLRSRFPKSIHFPDYATDELVRIFDGMCSKHAYRLDEGAADAVRERFAGAERGRGFGNARMARNLFEAAVAAQASRIVDLPAPLGDDILQTLTAVDIPRDPVRADPVPADPVPAAQEQASG